MLQGIRAPLQGCRRHSLRQQHSQVVAQATKEQEEAQAMRQYSENIGLPTDEGIFGFKPFSEIWVGRLAMGGFISSIVVEATTGRGTLQQVGLITPSLPLLATILALAGGAVTFGSFSTIFRATKGEMTANELIRYRQFLGIQKEDERIAETRKQGSPADRVLGPSDDPTNAQSEADPQSPDESAANTGASKFSKDDIITQPQFQNEGMKYARDVEVTNGRWAMLGFLAALIVEAGTGKGIIGQLIAYFKFLGLLGPASGF
jgi:hypothetical protein